MIKNKNINRLTVRTHKQLVSSDTLDEFQILGNRRDIRTSKVAKLKKLLVEGKHFETPFMANKVDGKYRLLDGNHRFEAIKSYLEDNKANKVEVMVCFYNNLSESEERTMYTQWNLGSKQTTNDYIRQYWATFPIVNMFSSPDSQFKVGKTWGNGVIEFRLLVGSYLTRYNETFQGTHSSSAQAFIESCQNLGRLDYDMIKVFMSTYIGAMGTPDRKNMHYKPAIFSTMFRIWLDNLDTKSDDTLQKAFIKCRGSYVVVDHVKLGSTREVVQQCRLKMLEHINGTRKTGLFV